MSDRNAILKEITEISFTADDLTLYLDTHPLDASALEAFSQANARRKSLLEHYANEFEPLTRNCVCPDTNNQTNSQPNTPDRNISHGMTGLCPGTSKEVLSDVDL